MEKLKVTNCTVKNWINSHSCQWEDFFLANTTYRFLGILSVLKITGHWNSSSQTDYSLKQNSVGHIPYFAWSNRLLLATPFMKTWVRGHSRLSWVMWSQTFFLAILHTCYVIGEKESKCVSYFMYLLTRYKKLEIPQPWKASIKANG